jgi:hypothetical protein
VVLALIVFASGHSLIDAADRKMMGDAAGLEGAEGLESVGGGDVVDAGLPEGAMRAEN